MPLGVDSIVQQASGDFEGTSGTVTLPAGTTAGSLILICASVSGALGDLRLGLPTGGAGSFEQVSSAFPAGTVSTRNWVAAFAQRNVAASETSWTLPIATGGSNQVVWHVYELSGVGLNPYPTWHLGTGGAGLSPLATTLVASKTGNVAPSSGQIDCYDTLSILLFGATSSDTTIPVISGYDTGYSEVGQASRVNADRAMAFAVAFNSIGDIGSFTAGASVSPSAYAICDLILLYADNARFVPDYHYIFGAEIGTATGLANGSIAAAGTARWDVVVGTPEIVTNHPRSGTYCLKLSSTVAAESVERNNAPGLIDGTFKTWVERFHFYFESLPIVDVQLHTINSGNFYFRAASGKIGFQIGTGTEILSDAAISAVKWIGVDYRYDGRPTNHLGDWMVDYDSLDTVAAPVTQTQAVGASTVADATITLIRYGWTLGTLTATVFFDDIIGDWHYGSYPIGDVRIVPLKVDPTGTPTVSGSSANFETFVNNGTGSAWTAADTRNRLDEVPPVVGGSADGLKQISVAASDYVRIPMETYDCAANGVSPRAVRWYIAGWASSGNPATCQVRSIDDLGVTRFEPVNFPTDHGFDSSTLRWICGMQMDVTAAGHYMMTQTHVDALALDFGFSDDANPDVGILAVIAELAVQPASEFIASDGEGGTFRVYVRQDPITQAVVNYLGSTPAGLRGLTMFGTVNSVDYSQYVAPAGTGRKDVGASARSEVTFQGMTVDPA